MPEERHPPVEPGGPEGRQPPDMWPTGSTVKYANPWMSIREDTFERTDGQTGVYGVVDKPDFALVIAEQDGRFHLVEQFRYPVARRSWEFPMGGWPPGKTGDTLALAKAELREETGLTARTWTHLGRLHEAPGFCSQGFDLFHATDLTPGRHAREDTEVDMVHSTFSEAELRAMIADGTIVDGTTVAAYGLLLVRR